MWTSIALFFLSPLLPWLTGYTLVAIVGIGIFIFMPSIPILNAFTSRFRNIAGIVGVIALLCGAHATYFFRAGEGHMAQRIAAKDRAAVERVEKSRINVDACNGGVDWNVTTGTCDSSN